jgi:ribose transport system permease protein
MTASSVPPDASRRPLSAVGRGSRFQMRFVAIWLAMLALILFGAMVVPRSLLPSTFLAVIPLAAFLALTAAGEAIVIMTRGIDLSIPAVITLSSTAILGFSAGHDDHLIGAVIAALLLASAVGLINGFFVAVFELNALIVTLAVGAVTAGLTLWYRESLPQESRVPPRLAEWGDTRFFGLNASVWVAILALAVLTIILRRTTVGRRFSAVGANPRTAWVAGINVTAYRVASFAVAGFLYGIVGILLSAFIRNPTLRVGEPYLLAPIAAAVLGGTAISGGIASMIAVGGAALFLTQLDQMMKMLGLSSAFQLVIEGIAIALGMVLANLDLKQLGVSTADRRGQSIETAEAGNSSVPRKITRNSGS